MKEYGPTIYRIVENSRIGERTMMMRLEGDTTPFSRPGQFVNIAIPGLTLRRPISVCDYDNTGLTIVYDIVGKGTEALAAMTAGTELDILPGLGNGFDTAKCGAAPVLLGGGVGCPPIYSLAKTLKAQGVTPTVILGFNSADRIIMQDMFEALDIPFYIATVDGSVGTRGFVTDVIREQGLCPSYFYACGPMPMLRALCTGLDTPGEVSIESRMGCGFGACMCCSVETAGGAKRICKDGPVFGKEELIWK
jgi:dihydroorotate dehydrogenase electron transfer subunit